MGGWLAKICSKAVHTLLWEIILKPVDLKQELNTQE